MPDERDPAGEQRRRWRRVERRAQEYRRRGPRRVWAPQMVSAVSAANDVALEREIEAIVVLLRERGPLSRQTLRREVEARFWGPGRFASALYEAQRQGRVRRVGFRTYAVAEAD